MSLMTKHCTCLTNCSFYSTKTMTASMIRNGAASADTVKTSRASYTPDVITMTDLHGIELLQSTLNPQKYYEHWGVEHALRSMDFNSLQRGWSHSRAYKDIHHIINGLIDAGIFRKDAYLGRMPFAGIKSFTRIALAVPIVVLLAKREEIEMHVMQRGYDPTEVFGLLANASVNAATNGKLNFSSEVCDHAFTILRSLPERVRKGVLMGRFESVQLFTATYKQIKGGN